MIEVHLYGSFRELVPGSRTSEDTILLVEPKHDEAFSVFVNRLGLDLNDLGDSFIDGVLAERKDVVTDGMRVGLFPFNMVLIDGGLHLKYHPNRRLSWK